MLNSVRESLLTVSAIAFIPLVSGGSMRPAAAQDIGQQVEQPSVGETTGPSAATTTVCRYDPDSGRPNVLGVRTYISLTENKGNTVVTLDRFPSFLTSAQSPERRADVGEVRSLTLYDTPIATARQLLVEQPAYYATLMELDVAEIGEGFAPINATLGCGQVAVTPESAEVILEETTETLGEDAASATGLPQQESADLATLPNGNYRFVSADFPNRVVSETELAESGGAVFLFRKFGENITGTLSYTGQASNICLAGNADGSTVVGIAYRRGSDFPEGSFLTLGEEGADAEYAGSVLDMESFSRINAGSRLPLESCS